MSEKVFFKSKVISDKQPQGNYKSKVAKRLNFLRHSVVAFVLIGIGAPLSNRDTFEIYLNIKENILGILCIVVLLVVVSMIPRFEWAQKELIYKSDKFTFTTDWASILNVLVVINMITIALAFNRKEDGSINWWGE